MCASMRDEKIDNSKWMLTLLIVLYHIQFTGCEKFQNGFMFIKNLGDCVVPAFAIISGFLFWRNVRHFADIRNKMTRRVRSLLIPYLLWNSINIPVMNFLRGKWGVDLLDFNFLYDIVLGDSSPHFWYIFMLMFWTFFSPILYFLYKNKWGVVVLFALSSVYLIYKGDSVLHSRFIYMIYVWAGLFGFRFPNMLGNLCAEKRNRRILYAIISFTVYFGLYFIYCEGQLGMAIKVWLYAARALFLLIGLMNLPLMKIGSMTNFKYSFWLFAIHFWLDVYFSMFVARHVLNSYLYQFFTLSLVLIFGLSIGFVVNRKIPALFRLLTGNREIIVGDKK